MIKKITQPFFSNNQVQKSRRNILSLLFFIGALFFSNQELVAQTPTISGTGTSASPITFRPATPGGVVFTGGLQMDIAGLAGKADETHCVLVFQ